MFFNFTNIVDSQDNVDLTPRGKPVTQRPTSQDRSPFKASPWNVPQCRILSERVSCHVPQKLR